MTAALAQHRFGNALERSAETAPAPSAPQAAAVRKGIFGWNQRFGAWVKAHPKLAVLLVIAL